MLANFKDFMYNVIVENLHPELQSLVQGGGGGQSKQLQLANKIKDLTHRGETTGIEGNMPMGSSRAYMQHSEPENITVDGSGHIVARDHGFDNHVERAYKDAQAKKWNLNR